MGRLARIVLPGVVHHITQRGVRSMDVFFEEEDRDVYIALLKDQSERVGLEFVGYCLMTNHIHLLLIPSQEDSLRRGIGEARRLYTRHINFREKTRGHLFQGRFFPAHWIHPIFWQRPVMLKGILSGVKCANTLKIINGQALDITLAYPKMAPLSHINIPESVTQKLFGLGKTFLG